MPLEARQLTGKRHDLVSLCHAEPPWLEEALRLGLCPAEESLAGAELRGIHLSQLAALTGTTKFRKVFRQSLRGLTGHDVACYDNALGAPWIERTDGAARVLRGAFDAYPVALTDRDHRYPNALMLNYGTSSESFVLSPRRAVRAYLVQVYPDDHRLLLGKAYLAVGVLRRFYSYFVLERALGGARKGRSR